MIYHLKIFFFIWVIYKMIYEVRQMKFELSVLWIKKEILRRLNCWYCFTFWLTLTIERDIFAASALSFLAYILGIIINKIQTIKL